MTKKQPRAKKKKKKKKKKRIAKKKSTKKTARKKRRVRAKPVDAKGDEGRAGLQALRGIRG